MADSGFTVEGWEEFVENFAKVVDRWDQKKAELLKRMGTIYQSKIIPHVPADTSTLAYSIKVFGDGIPQDYIEVGSNLNYALFVNDGHIQHRRFLPVAFLSAGGKKKQYKTSKDGKYIMLSERYIPGVYYMEKGFADAKPSLQRAVESFMLQTAREVEGGNL